MNHHKFSVLVSAALLMLLLSACATLREPAPNADISLSTQAYNTPNQGNPIMPGYWADPSLHIFGDTFYIYFTSEGGERGAYTWKSSDKKNWTLAKMPFTDATIAEFWAPSVLEANGQYYLYYSKALNGMFVATAPTPEGPWTERTEL